MINSAVHIISWIAFSGIGRMTIEKYSKLQHLEKVCLLEQGIGTLSLVIPVQQHIKTCRSRNNLNEDGSVSKIAGRSVWPITYSVSKAASAVCHSDS